MAPVPARRQDFGPKSDTHFQALRAFLRSKGYDLPVHGGNGPLLRSALKNWSSGVQHRNPTAWSNAHPVKMDMNPHVKPGTVLQPNAGHPIEQKQTQLENQATHDTHKALQTAADKNAGTKNLPKHNVPSNSPTGHFHPGAGNGGNNGGIAPEMLNGLIGHTNTEKMMPLSLADQAASPYTSLAATLGDQINRLPAAKQQALQNISDWFGQVQSAEKKGAGQDQALADAGSAAMQDAAKGIAAGLGGSASGAGGQIGAVGANDANTMTAIGANDAALANELAPIFKLSAADAKNTRSQQYDNQLSDLKDQQGQAQGQADAARATAIQAILGANNQARQTNYGNAAGLYNTLAGLQISGMNAMSQAQARQIENAYKMSEIQKNAQGQQGGLSAMTPMQRADFVNKIVGSLVDPNTGKLKSGIDWPTALRDARNFVRTAGMNPADKNVIGTIIGPALSQSGITGKGPNGYWPAIYQP